MIMRVDVYKLEDGSYTAISQKIAAMWANSPTIDGAIEQFNKQYRSLLEEGIQSYDFHVILS